MLTSLLAGIFSHPEAESLGDGLILFKSANLYIRLDTVSVAWKVLKVLKRHRKTSHNSLYRSQTQYPERVSDARRLVIVLIVW